MAQGAANGTSQLTREFKREAVKLAPKPDVSRREAARQLRNPSPCIGRLDGEVRDWRLERKARQRSRHRHASVAGLSRSVEFSPERLAPALAPVGRFPVHGSQPVAKVSSTNRSLHIGG